VRVSGAPITAQARREARRSTWAVFLHALLAPAGAVSQAEAARLTGAGLTKIAQWCSPEHASQMPVSDVEVLPEAARIAVVERILGPGYRVARVEAEASVGDDLRAMARIAQQGGEVVARYAAALADDNISPEEAGQMLPVVRELARSLATLEHDLVETVKERGRRRLRAVGGR
jgi:hypothetical protein